MTKIPASTKSTEKDTIYLETDDEISAIIDKVRRSPHKIVALVLPKRASGLLSSVNLKLLKFDADEGQKKVVLITSDPAIKSLAALAQIHVAKSLVSKPQIPKISGDEKGTDEFKIDNQSANLSVEEDDEKANKPADGKFKADNDLEEPEDNDSSDDDDDVVEIDNDVSPTEKNAEGLKSKLTFNKKLKIPNFERFRLRLVLVILVFIGLAGGIYWGLVIAPKAVITIQTDTTNVDLNLEVVAGFKQPTLDVAAKLIPATNAENKKTETKKVAATGQKDIGNKAKGKITLTNCIDDGLSHTISAGTSFTSGQLSFVTDEAVTLDPALYSGSTCKSSDFGLDKTVNVTAASPGDKYNLNARSYSVPASLATADGSVMAYGNNMSGGTTQLVKVVSQNDVDVAKQQLMEQAKSKAVSELKDQLKAQAKFVISDSITNTEPVVTSNPAVNAEASETTITINSTFKIIAIAREDIKKLYQESMKSRIDASKQALLNLDQAIDDSAVRIGKKLDNGDQTITLITTISAGPKQDAEAIKKEVAGKKKAETVRIIQTRPGVKNVTLSYTPFWVSKTPTKQAAITIEFKK